MTKQENQFSSFKLKLQSLNLDFLFQAPTFTPLPSKPLTGTSYFLATGLKLCRQRWMRKLCALRTNEQFQSLKDDSLSELLPAASWSSEVFVPPSGTGASGVLWSTENKSHIVCQFIRKLVITRTVI